MKQKDELNSFADYPWQLYYRTACPGCDGEPVNILRDFYVPVLARAIHYDRVAGFFRPTSLAAASQGLSVFTIHSGRARFIIGVDSLSEDIQSILDGYKEREECYDRLADLLNAELEGFESWTENVQNGVHLLAWMLVKGLLEIRVAFRVNISSGKAISYYANDDGYIHRKWSIFKDAMENRIYAAGDLNESETSLTLNAENLEIHCEWKNEDNRKRIENAEYEFEMLWDDLNPYIRVLKLPQKIRERLITIADYRNRAREIDGSGTIILEPPNPSAMERLQFALIKDGPRLPGGRFVGMQTTPITPWPHQNLAARRLIESWPYSFMLCDEVGLGKTIEVGLAIRSLYLSGLLQKVLIVAPASLTEQWQREMSAKFFLPFARAQSGTPPSHYYLLPLEEEVKSASLYSPDLNIVSMALLTAKKKISDLLAVDHFDLTVVDEAYLARRTHSTQKFNVEPQYNNLFRIISEILRPKTKSLYLAAPAPLPADPLSIHDLMKLTRRIGPFQFNPGLGEWYYEILMRILQNELITESEWRFLRKSILDIENHDPFYFDILLRTAIDAKNRTLIKNWLEHEIIPKKTELDHIIRLIYSAAPLSRVMIRYTRPLLKIYRQEGKLNSRLAERVMLPIRILKFTDQERSCYEHLRNYCGELSLKVMQDNVTSPDPSSRGDKVKKASLSFYLSFLHLRFASSIYALRETLRRRLEKITSLLSESPPSITLRGGIKSDEMSLDIELDREDDESEDDIEIVQTILKNRSRADIEWEQDYLSRMLENMSDLSEPSSKFWELLKILDYNRRIYSTGRNRQTVIFTRFYDTLIDIISHLRQADPKMLIGAYSEKGGQYIDSESYEMVSTSRDDVKRRFLREEIDVLICTDAAAEGLNLQTADMAINFDLPWNPIKLERRISRMDRMGQKYDRVEILNLCYFDSPEEIVYGRILKKLETEESNAGNVQQFYFPLITSQEFWELTDGKLTESDLENRVKERTDTIKKRMTIREIPDRELYGIYCKLDQFENRSSKFDARTSVSPLQFPNLASPISLDTIWEVLYGSKYFQEIGCSLHGTEKSLLLKNIQGIADGTVITASREIYEYGLKDIKGKLHFATYGDPVFEILLNHIDAFGLPACVKRFEIEKSDFTVPMAGYVAACLDEKGQSIKRLITSPVQLEGLVLDEQAALSFEDGIELLGKLEKISQREFQNIYLAEGMERSNQAVAISQFALDCLIIQSYIQTCRESGTFHNNFWDMTKEITDACREKETLLIPNLPVELIIKLYGLIFEPQIPDSGNYASLNAPVQLVRSSLDTVCRLASAMRIDPSSLQTDDVLARLDRELKAIL